MSLSVLTVLSPLDVLAEQINREHQAVCDAVSSSFAHAVRAGELLLEAKANVPHGAWLPWLADHFDGSDRTAQVYMKVAQRRDEIVAQNRSESAVLTLDAALKSISSSSRKSRSAEEDAADVAAYYTVEAWNRLPDGERRRIIEMAPSGSSTTFNQTGDRVDWAAWTWNPVTGCDHGCGYCYARVLAQRYYTDLAEDQRFTPVFRPARLHAARHTRLSDARSDAAGERLVARHHGVGDATDAAMWEAVRWQNVFVGSMTDLFGKWVPQDWIDAVFSEVVASPQWNYLFLTKFPQRLAQQDWPDQAWVGASVDRQARVATAERSFRDVQAGVKWLSCEPLLERLTFSALDMFDWVVIGAQSANSQVPEFQPPWEWVEHLVHQAQDAGCRIYLKPNLHPMLREYPG